MTHLGINHTPDTLSRRLLGAMQLGITLVGRDGHIWIETVGQGDDVYADFDDILAAGGILINNKIYGGILQALDTIDEALRQCGHEPLEHVCTGIGAGISTRYC